MRLTLNKKEKIVLDYSECPRCHNPYNAKSRKKTLHHAIPLFLKPKTMVEVALCKECHDELNKNYSHIGKAKKTIIKNSTFKEFKETYENLRDKYHSKQLNRGEFGEGLWSNLMSYLEKTSKGKRK